MTTEDGTRITEEMGEVIINARPHSLMISPEDQMKASEMTEKQITREPRGNTILLEIVSYLF